MSSNDDDGDVSDMFNIASKLKNWKNSIIYYVCIGPMKDGIR